MGKNLENLSDGRMKKTSLDSVDCPDCSGTGKIGDKGCPICNGVGNLTKAKLKRIKNGK